MATIGIVPKLADILQVGDHSLQNFDMEVGSMDYSFEINGILGMDFLVQTGAIINLREMKFDFLVNDNLKETKQ